MKSNRNKKIYYNILNIVDNFFFFYSLHIHMLHRFRYIEKKGELQDIKIP